MSAIYAVYPGYVLSKNDGDRHYINEQKLCRLYGVSPAVCLVVVPEYYADPSMREYIAVAEKLIPLRPRSDGNYTLPSS